MYDTVLVKHVETRKHIREDKMNVLEIVIVISSVLIQTLK